MVLVDYTLELMATALALVAIGEEILAVNQSDQDAWEAS